MPAASTTKNDEEFDLASQLVRSTQYETPVPSLQSAETTIAAFTQRNTPVYSVALHDGLLAVHFDYDQAFLLPWFFDHFYWY